MATRLFEFISKKIKRLLYAPNIKVDSSENLTRLGSEYGGWTFEDSPDLRNSVIVSCGLGEDASFDVEFSAAYSARVIIVDPTPRAVKHFEQIKSRTGLPNSEKYGTTGRQPASSYDLSRLDDDSLRLEPVALWTEASRLKFFAPPNPDHVSHSIVNYQNKYKDSTPYIEVEALTPESLLDKHRLGSVPLMKLDIEGAEIQVIPHMLRNSLKPRQILVEFDELNTPGPRAKKNVEATDRSLRDAGYQCRFFDHRCNCLYVLAN